MFSNSLECPCNQSEQPGLFAGESLHWIIQIIMVFHTLRSSEYLLLVFVLFCFLELTHSNSFILTCGKDVLCLYCFTPFNKEFKELHLLTCGIHTVWASERKLPCHRYSFIRNLSFLIQKKKSVAYVPICWLLRSAKCVCKWGNSLLNSVIKEPRKKCFGHWLFKIYFDIIADLKVARIVREFPYKLYPDSPNVNMMCIILFQSQIFLSELFESKLQAHCPFTLKYLSVYFIKLRAFS